jgi:hypothetical protein
MEKWRMTILYDQRLAGESLAHILEKELYLVVCLFSLEDPDILVKLETSKPDLLMIVEEEAPCAQAVLLTAQILEAYPSLPLVRIKLSQHILHLYTSHAIPARSPDLIEAIQKTLMAHKVKGDLLENPKRS